MKLPIMDFEKQIINAVASNPVTVIEADTGAGKSTQVPYMLYMAGLGNITVTQPRVMAAISLANRVAEEFGEEVGIDIGYKTRFYKTEASTPITYVTDGYLLSTYGRSNAKEVVILDEAHEFNLNEETLMGLYKKELRTNPNLKLVVMSATIDSKKISQFFNDAPIISVPGRLYPVEQHWEPSMRIEDCIFKYFTAGTNMLVFLPGKEEIARTYNELKIRFSLDSSKGNPQLFQLHGEMAYEEQKNVFSHYESGKIILATNVAQTSITVPDIDFVIDTGTCKEMVSHDGISKLTAVNISQADCSQRAGRAGRCKPGTYVLCSSTPFEHRPYFSTPEIQRISLENLVLKLATMNIDPLDIEFLHNPDRGNLKLAKELLVKIGAIKKDGTITKIGAEMEQMPVSARIARMLLEARKYSPEVQGDMAIIAALFECGDFRGKGFYYNSWIETRECKKSDLTYQLHIFKDMNAKWQVLSYEERKDFYKANNIKAKVYQNILKVSKDIADKLGLKYMLYKKTRDEDFAKIRSCIISAYVDCIYVFAENYRGLSYLDPKSKAVRKLDRTSVFSDAWADTPEFILAQPLDIEVKNSIYGLHTIALIKNATAVSIDDNKEVINALLDMATLSYSYDSVHDVLYEVWRVNYVEIKREISTKKPVLVERNSTCGHYIYTDVMVEGYVIDVLY